MKSTSCTISCFYHYYFYSFVIICQPRKQAEPEKQVKFSISPESINTTKKATKVPNFLIKGHLETVVCDIRNPFNGEFIVEHSEIPIKSIELQLVRIETCGMVFFRLYQHNVYAFIEVLQFFDEIMFLQLW